MRITLFMRIDFIEIINIYKNIQLNYFGFSPVEEILAHGLLFIKWKQGFHNSLFKSPLLMILSRSSSLIGGGYFVKKWLGQASFNVSSNQKEFIGSHKQQVLKEIQNIREIFRSL